jgi:hypothetical protein
MAEDSLIDLVLTDRLLGEWERVIVREHHRTPEAAKKIADLIRTGFATSLVPNTPTSRTWPGWTDPTPTTCTTWPPPSTPAPTL